MDWLDSQGIRNKKRLNWCGRSEGDWDSLLKNKKPKRDKRYRRASEKCLGVVSKRVVGKIVEKDRKRARDLLKYSWKPVEK